MLAGSSPTFTWSAGTGVTAYFLSLGTNGPGSANLFESGSTTATTVAAKGLPTSGATVNATLFSMIGGVWQPVYYTFTASQTAALTGPVPGTTLPGSTVIFNWTADADATAYFLSLGTNGPGSANLFESGSTTATTATAKGLPTNGAAVNATLFSKIGGVWEPVYYTYTESQLAALTGPTPGTTLSGSTVTFNWTADTNATAYFLSLGTNGPGSANLFESGSTTAMTVTAKGLPLNGTSMNATLFSKIGGVWEPSYYTYIEATAPAMVKTLTCANASMTGSGTDSCTATLMAAAPSGGAIVSLASNDSAVTAPASVSVAAGLMSATFTATVSAVSSTQTASLTANAGGVSQSFSLQLNAGSPVLSAIAGSLAFGEVSVETVATQGILLSSSGTLPVTVNSVTLTGAGFSVSGATFPVTLNPGVGVTLEVAFDPASAGAATGQLTIASNSSTGTMDIVGLSGTGLAVSYQVNLSWTAPQTSGNPIAGYNVYRAPAGGSIYQLMSSSLDDGTTYVDSTVANSTTYDYYVESVDELGASSAPSTMVGVPIP